MHKISLIQGKGDWEATPPTGASDADLYHIVNDFMATGGVVDKDAGHMLVEERDTPSMSVKIAKGVIYVPNASWVDSSTEPKFWRVVAEEEENLAIPSNSSGSTRYDIVCQKVDTITTPNDDADNVCPYVLVAGTPGEAPPAIPANHKGLAIIEVDDGEVSITNDNITDIRDEIVFDLKSVSNDGYIPSSVTMEYASATSVTVEGEDVTDIFQPGTKVKFTNNSITYYGYVKSSVFSVDTTINFIENLDYTIANSAITDIFYSYEANPQDFPHYLNYNFDMGTFTVGNGVKKGRFSVTGRTVHFDNSFKYGSTSSVSVGQLRFGSLPIAPRTPSGADEDSYRFPFAVALHDQGAGNLFAGMMSVGAGTVTPSQVINSTGITSNTSPVTSWGAGDGIFTSGSYEI